ncbi:MAG: HyaD/HybD family hydrogenase maturation endopeptidase [Sedimentisphaeraceae bacterium JB056]
MTEKFPILVLGIGNILLSDEGVGVKVVYEMQNKELPSGVELYDGGTAGADLLDVIANRKKVIVVDAIEGDYKPGTIVKFALDDIEQAKITWLGSLHDVNIKDTFEMTKLLGCRPQEITCVGIKPASIECGTELTPQIKEAIPHLVNCVFKEIEC